MNIKACIDLLIKILNGFGFTKLKSETFRLAKFNETSAAASLWRLLFEVIYFVKYDTIDDICIRAYGRFSKEELAVFVKKELQRSGFLSRDFEYLPSNMSSGSRELLLAFGWLLCKESVFQRFVDKSVEPLNEDGLAPSPEEAQELSRSTGSGGLSNLTNGEPASPRDKLRQLVWMNGRLRMSLRSLFWLRRENVRKEHEIAKATEGLQSGDPTRMHLNALEVAMIRNPELLRKQLQLLEQDNQRLQSLLKWSEAEEEFWRWMESVLDLKLSETPRPATIGAAADSDVDTCSAVATSASSISLVSESSFSGLTEAHKKLHDSLVKYESIAELLEKQLSDRTLNVSSGEVDLMIAAIDEEIESFNRKLGDSLSSSSTLSRLFSVDTRAPVVLASTCNDAEPSRVARGGPQDLVVNVEREVERLEAMLSKLETDVENNYVDFKNDIQNVSAVTNGLVLYDQLA